jgi:hypothetical protein
VLEQPRQTSRHHRCHVTTHAPSLHMQRNTTYVHISWGLCNNLACDSRHHRHHVTTHATTLYMRSHGSQQSTQHEYVSWHSLDVRVSPAVMSPPMPPACTAKRSAGARS